MVIVSREWGCASRLLHPATYFSSLMRRIFEDTAEESPLDMKNILLSRKLQLSLSPSLLSVLSPAVETHFDAGYCELDGEHLSPIARAD
jgi:hypothetical protein